MEKSQQNKDKEYMQKAMNQALLAMDDGEVPIGAVIVAGDTIIAKAYNQVERLCDTTAHAEMLAITSASAHLGAKYLDECTMYVTLEPCLMCAGALAWSQIGRLVIGARDEKRGFLGHGNSILHPKTEVTTDVLREDSHKLLRTFFESKR